MNLFTFSYGILSKCYNHGQNIYRLSHIILAQYHFTTNESELNYYHQKVNVPVASRVGERLKSLDLKKLEDFEKIHESLGIAGKSLACVT